MTGLLARLVILAALSGAAGRDPSDLVADLSSRDEAVRTEAAGALEELGRPALPALYRLRASDDAALRQRAEPLIDLIERQRLLRATKVRLDFEDVPLSGVVEAIASQTGLRLAVEPDDPLGASRVTLRAPEPLAFWSALDRVGGACGVQFNPAVLLAAVYMRPFKLLGLAEGPPAPASDVGPFRIYLVHLARHNEAVPARARGEVKRAQSLTADLQVFAEPGLAANPARPAVLREAVDDRGNDIRPDRPVGPVPPRLWAPHLDEAHAGLFSFSVSLKPGAAAGGRIRRLRGYIPVSIIARTGDPIIVPLTEAEGKTVSRGAIAVRVDDVQHQGQVTAIRVTIRGEQASPQVFPGLPTQLGDYQPPYRIQDHVEIRDDGGRLLSYIPGPLQNAEDGGLVTQLTVSKGPNGTPARLLYHGVVGVATELVFEFADLPLP